VSTFSLATIAVELRDAQGGLDPFNSGDPATDMRAVFSWSYRALGDAAARLFRLLAVHPGPDLATPAAASLAGAPPDQIRPLLAELTRAHLILVGFLDRQGHWHDLATTGHTALAAARCLADPPTQAHTHRNLARAYIQLGRHDDAQAHLQDALDLSAQA
jgi:hypothetical protein